MNAKSVPPPTQQELATDRLITAVESAINGIQEHLSSRAADAQDAKWSISDLVKLLQLRDQLQAQQPRRYYACWVNDPRDLPSNNRNHTN